MYFRSIRRLTADNLHNMVPRQKPRSDVCSPGA